MPFDHLPSANSPNIHLPPAAFISHRFTVGIMHRHKKSSLYFTNAAANRAHDDLAAMSGTERFRIAQQLRSFFYPVLLRVQGKAATLRSLPSKVVH
jgi:hypothetical protein